jgi:kynurenine--oxoglutarate transaminase/cysteine-S-conjugate beta-lyase/glutamine--phenylpyruvate transaminase
VDLSQETDSERDYRFTKYMTKNIGVQGIPPSAFYNQSNKYLGEDYVRYCYFKTQDNLQQAANILHKWKSGN